MSEINGQTDDVAPLVNWFFRRPPFPSYENFKGGHGMDGGRRVTPAEVDGGKRINVIFS